MSRSCSYKN